MKNTQINMFGKLVLTGLLVVFLSTLGFAQTTGKISGKVVDKKTGEALLGVSILIEGTNWGAATDLEGNFFILNIPPNVYNVRVQMVGFESTLVQGVGVSVNRTTNLELELSEAVLELGETVIITADKISSKKDQTGSIKNVTTEQIEALPVESLADIVNLQAGVVKGHFRGGRRNEVSYLVDGLSVTESYGKESKAVEVETDVIQEVEVITGTFNAEYGNAMSGVVNAVTKDGGNEFKAAASASASNFYTSNKDVFIGLKDDDFFRNKDLKVLVSGPIVPNLLSFVVNTRYQNYKNYLNGIDRFKVDDYSIFTNTPETWYSENTGSGEYVPMNNSETYSVFGKLSFNPITDVRSSFTYTRNKDTWQNYDHAYKYTPDGLPTSRKTTNMYALNINHMLSDKMFYELKASYIDTRRGSSVYENPLDPNYVNDNYSRNDPGFYTGGQSKGYSLIENKDLNLKADLVWQVSDNHTFKTGVQYVLHELDVQNFSIRNEYFGTGLESESYYDSVRKQLVFKNYKPVVLPDSSIYTDKYNVKPFEIAYYLQDKMEFDNMVVNVGVRLDYFNPNTKIPSNWRNPSNLIRFPDNPEKMSTYSDADDHLQISPRIGLSYELGEAALLRFAYGHFFQMPPLYALYQNSSFVISTVNYQSVLGNPEVKPQKTVSYELGLWQQLMDGMGVEVAVFYRDIYDLLGTQVITTYNQVRYGLYSNLDYGNVKGLELKYDFVSGPFTVLANYTLQYTKGNADNPTFTFNRAGQTIDPVNKLIRMSWDQRHTFNISFGYNAEDYGATLTGYYNSGTPYTWSPIPESPLARVNLFPNNSAKPNQVTIDLSAFYSLYSNDIVEARLTLLVKNLLDTLNEEDVYGKTGRAYNDIIRDYNIEGHKSDFNTYEDIIQNPAMYSAPREVKLGLELRF